MIKYQKNVLANGLQLIMVPMRVSSATVLVGVGSGSRDETASKSGLSHFLEHMAWKGTKSRPTPFRVASVIDSIGGEQNAGTSKEFTEYFVKVASEHIGAAFDILADILKNPIFDLKQIEKERQVIIEEINMYEDLPMRKVVDDFELLLYGKNSLGRDISGDKKSVARIKREDFLTHLNTFYEPGKMVLVVAGKFSAQKVRNLAAEFFGDWQRGKKKRRGKLKLDQTSSKLKVIYKKTDQAHFVLGVPGVNYKDKDRFVVSVAASILGYSRTSRIYREIREKRGWAYYVSTSPEYYTDVGSFYTRAGVSLGKIEEAIKIVKNEYERLAEVEVGERELKRAKDYIKGRFVLALEDSFNVASRYAIQAVVEGKLRTPGEVIKLIDKVSAEDVLRVSGCLFRPGKLNLALIGPYRDEKKFKKLLG